MAGSAAVQSVYDDFRGLYEVLRPSDPSGLASLERIYPKVLLLASASHLEVATIEAISNLYGGHSVTELQTFVKKRSLERSFHSLFDWSAPSANGFFGLFGPDCKKRYTDLRKSDDTFASYANAFLEIGSMRNRLVHQNYAQFRLEKTANEILKLDLLACEFPAYISVLVLNT